MNASLQDVRARNLRTVALLAALFLIPLLAAFGMYYGAGWRPAQRTNHGELILPVRELPRASAYGAKTFTHLWSLVYVGAGACDDSCARALYVMRQTHLGLNNTMQRVQRVWIATGEAPARESLVRDYPGLVVVQVAGREGEELVRQFPADERAHAIFIVDPLGNLMMRFDSRANPQGLREDLTKLLKLSHVG
ncbi:MAG TPA: hypothetical protein VK820_02300 [Steroidobacteraceae bacterium]|jgi:hypothetical protein|nr:hypothetical protein [Steroidobacteraceae bacterium]